MVRYIYDAWGNHTVRGNDGTEIAEATHIGNINPIRYRGYYYDTEIGLYYLQTRYYDPTTGRFVTIDGIAYADPESINGLNLYAYCGNNPVMNVDETGTMPNWLKWLLGGLAFIGAVVLTVFSGGSLAPVFIGMGVSIIGDALLQGTVNALSGGSFWSGFWDGAADGALWGGVFALAGAGIRIIKILKKGVVIGESMNRVNAAAKRIGAITYKAPGMNILKIFGKNRAFAINKALNKKWINRMMKWGVKIFDIGEDALRVVRSPFYEIESIATKGYWNLFKIIFG